LGLLGRLARRGQRMLPGCAAPEGEGGGARRRKRSGRRMGKTTARLA